MNEWMNEWIVYHSCWIFMIKLETKHYLLKISCVIKYNAQVKETNFHVLQNFCETILFLSWKVMVILIHTKTNSFMHLMMYIRTKSFMHTFIVFMNIFSKKFVPFLSCRFYKCSIVCVCFFFHWPVLKRPESILDVFLEVS